MMEASTSNLNNTAPSIGTIAGCSDQRERNITTGLFGLKGVSTVRGVGHAATF